MNWKEVKEVCNKYNVGMDFCNIRFIHLPFTKKYFTRRPKWEVFEFSGDDVKKDSVSLMNIERYCWVNNNYKYTKAPIFYYKPTELTSIPSYSVEEFLEKGTIPPGFFRRWGTSPVPIYTAEEFENAINEFKTYLETCNKLTNSVDLKNFSDSYKNIQAEIEQKQNELFEIRKKYKQCFCKQAGLASDF